MSTRWLIVGLGNPGSKYSRTRHNAGFWFLDALDRRIGLALKTERKFHGDAGKTRLGAVDVVGLKPDTFMNDSGRAVRAVAAYFDIPIDRILVAYDDLDLPPGTVRLKLGGGHGGHNGLRSLFSHLGDPGFWRLRIGIGHPGVREAVTPWVLSRAGAEDERGMIEAIDRAIDIVPTLLRGETDRALQALHTAPPDPAAADPEQHKGEKR
ncbi:aminoacyl-tRNA hydrolase [Wenzhouxiangella limi]|uniref:Peptidyl-tRNA hydrolase n=1 Tax=Wenzhouxiangella limi TaxID=2707351 RepID=A0A845V2D5_9GAMM|nr:aminoacyl-tRNA hydrolase [Wenzhouxiangella limi]